MGDVVQAGALSWRGRDIAPIEDRAKVSTAAVNPENVEGFDSRGHAQQAGESEKPTYQAEAAAAQPHKLAMRTSAQHELVGVVGSGEVRSP